MRVERFFLFFPPKVVSITRGETEYGIGAIPLGGFVKITGMNPEEEIPPEVEDRAYYRQPVWKRIVVIAAGPFVNIVLALVMFFILAVRLRARHRADEHDRRRSTTSSPPAGQLAAGRRAVSIDGVRVDGLEGERARRHGARAGRHPRVRRRADRRLRGDDAGRLVVERDGEPVELDDHARPTRRPRRCRGSPTSSRGCSIGFGYEPMRERSSAAEGAEFAVDRALARHDARPPRSSPASSRPRQREQITGVVGATEVTRQSFEFDTRQAIGVLAVISLSLGPRQPAALPAARRRPHLLGDRREGPRPAGARCGSWSARGSSGSRWC